MTFFFFLLSIVCLLLLLFHLSSEKWSSSACQTLRLVYIEREREKRSDFSFCCYCFLCCVLSLQLSFFSIYTSYAFDSLLYSLLFICVHFCFLCFLGLHVALPALFFRFWKLFEQLSNLPKTQKKKFVSDFVSDFVFFFFFTFRLAIASSSFVFCLFLFLLLFFF